MPDNILSDFFYGNIVPSEKHFDKNSEFGKVVDEMSKNELALKLSQVTAKVQIRTFS